MPTFRKRPLNVRDILAWATRHRECTGAWPTKDTPGVIGGFGISWLAVDAALRAGLRGLPGGGSLAQLLAEHCGRRNIKDLPPLTEEDLLRRADEHHARTGSWPTRNDGDIPNSGGENWMAVDNALRLGLRGLSRGSSLAKLLARGRGVRNRKGLPRLTEDAVLAWADAHRSRTGDWPGAGSGPVADAPGETWLAVQMALRHGRRGLPGGSSLPLLLADRRGARNVRSRPNLTTAEVLSWADEHRDRTGDWPHSWSGPIAAAPAETWNAVDHALKRGSRGLVGDSSLARLLAAERGVRNHLDRPPLTRKLILNWACRHHRRTGKWPTMNAGPVVDAPGETWLALDACLKCGHRGLRGGSSLARLLELHGKKRSHLNLPALTIKGIVAWADAHRERTGAWPCRTSGPVAEEPDEDWKRIDQTLRSGGRGLAGGTSLVKLLARKRGVRNPAAPPPLSMEQILGWVDRHVIRTGVRPRYNDGPISDAPGETWAGLDNALRKGTRGLAGGSSLAKFLRETGR
jgi:hypothetical protein